MATITTTTNTTPFIWPSTSLIERGTNGFLYVMVKATTANTFELWRSIDNGGSWSLLLSVVRANVVQLGPIQVLRPGYNQLVWTYRTNEGSQDRVYLRTISDLGSPAWNAETIVAAVANGGVAGAVYTGMDMVTATVTGQYHYAAVAIGVTSGAQHGALLVVNTGSTLASMAINANAISGTRQWLITGSGWITPSLDIEHTGDAHSGSSPHLWLTFGRSQVHTVKLAWTGTGWSGPATSTKMNPATLTPPQDSITARWDGSRWLIIAPDPVSTTQISVWERNRSNTETTFRQTPAHPTGVVRNCSLSYNPVNGDFRVYAVGTSSAVLYFVDFIRATGLWTSWAIVTATAVLGATGNNWTVRRSSNARYDVITAHSGAPNTLVHTAQSLSYTPNPPVWDTASMGVPHGGAADVAATRLLDWTFSDPDPADVQSAYAISRQIGAGALAYWRASDSTWQVAEVQNASATSAITLASAWAVATDAAYTYRVKTWDSASLPSAYSDAYTVIPSAKVNPTITSPTAAQVLATDTVTPTWTVAEETAYRITLATNPGGLVVYDSGWVASSALTTQVPYRLPDLTGWTLSLQTRNLEGLPSNVVTVNFTIDYLEPQVPTIVATPSTTFGQVNVAVTNPAPTGTQPAVQDQDLYRRAVAGPNMLTNPGFEVDTSGWQARGGATMTRSTAQFHSGIASALITPDGVGTPSRIECLGSQMAFVSEGQSWTVDGWLRPTTANKPLELGINWADILDAFVTASTLQVAAVAGAWLYLQATFAVPIGLSVAKAGLRVGVANTPAVGDTVYVDDLRLRPADVTTGTRVAAALPGGAVFPDWTAVHGVAYEYRTLTRGVNGTSIYGPWTA